MNSAILFSVGVNALSGLYLISTELMLRGYDQIPTMCQCPLGLIPHFYVISCGSYNEGCYSVNALSGLYLISTLE